MSKDLSKLETGSTYGSIASYAAGFLLSLLLTLSAYFIVTERLLSKNGSISAIVGLAILQTVVQLLFFLHLGNESKPRWNLLSFLFMVLVSVILVFGTLWIMYSLDANVMPAENSHLMHHKES